MADSAATSIRIIYEAGEGEITEKKSRFIATIRAVSSEEAATAFIAEMKKKYWDARHNCSAFIIGDRQELTRCSDDGEPAQTAGRPMLDVLLKEGLTNVAVVVTRYFGGVLLGTGGLVRAYQAAVHAGLDNCLILEKRTGFLLSVRTDYNGVGKLQYLFGQRQITIVSSEYGADVIFQVLVPSDQKEAVEKAITEVTNGSSILRWDDEVAYGILDKQPVIL